MIQTVETGMNFLSELNSLLPMHARHSLEEEGRDDLYAFVFFCYWIAAHNLNKESHICLAPFYQVLCKYYTGPNANLGQ